MINCKDNGNASNRVQSIMNMNLDNNKEAIDALKDLSAFYTSNSPENRRNLKSAIDRSALDLYGEFVEHLKSVHLSLDKVHTDVSAMHSTVNDMWSKLSLNRTKTLNLIEETSHFREKIQNVAKKQEFSKAIIERFQLKPSEVKAISDGNVSLDMLSAVRTCEAIQAKCLVLENIGCHQLVQDIVNQVLHYKEKGLERLFEWAKARVRTIEQPDPMALLPLTMNMLQGRPQFFEEILSEYCTNRRDMLVRQLISALTRGGQPIEHRATQPKRYVGDILAWLHQAVPAESDSLAYLLRKCDFPDGEDQIDRALCSITEGVCHPLKVRIEHILLSEINVRDPLLVQALLTLLRYYHQIIKQIVGQGKLEHTLQELCETGERTLMISLTGRVAVLLNSPTDKGSSQVSHTLIPSQAMLNALSLLTQVLAVDISTPEALVQKISSCVVDPVLLNAMETAATARLSVVDSAVFLLNVYNCIEVELAMHPFLDNRLEKLRVQTDAQIDILTSEQASCLIAHLSLGTIYTALQGPLPTPLSRLATFDASHISSISGKLKKIISNVSLYLLPQLSLLTNVTRRRKIVRNAGAVVHSIYLQLYQLVHDPTNQFDRPETILANHPDAIHDAFQQIYQ